MTKLTVIAGFVLAFFAGLMVGMAGRPALSGTASHHGTSTQPGHHQRSWWVNELNLTPQQQEQMQQIWSETARSGGRDHEERRRQYRKDRDDAITALVRPEDVTKYNQILKTYSENTASLDNEWRSAYQSAVERTKGILTPEQRAEYETILKRHSWGSGGRERDRRPHGDRDKGGRGHEHDRPGR